MSIQGIPEPVHVTLNYPPLGLVRATTRSFGLDGIAVDTGAITLPNNAEVEITLSWRDRDSLRVCRVAGSVSTQDGNGTRLDWGEEGWRQFEQMLGRSGHVA